MVSNGQLKRNLRKQQLNRALSYLPAFTPCSPYKIYHINRFTTTLLLHDLILLARETTLFTVDTETDYYSHQAALIQIEFIQQQHSSIVLLIEIHHLDDTTSVSYWMIRSLLKIIFNDSNVILSWGDLKDELEKFIPCGLFSYEIVQQINNIDIQEYFKNWHDTLLCHEDVVVFFHNIELVHAYSMKSLENMNHKWSLQMAIVYRFQQFLDKNRTNSDWERCLDVNNSQKMYKVNRKEKKIMMEMIEYAANDCLAVTKLAKAFNLF